MLKHALFYKLNTEINAKLQEKNTEFFCVMF